MRRGTAFLSGIVLLAFGGMAQAASVAVSSEQTTANVGETFTLDLNALGLPTGSVGGSINLSFDSTIIELKNLAFDTTVWEFDTRIIDDQRSNGQLGGLSFSSFAGRTGDAKIATLSFEALKAGLSAITLSLSNQNPFVDGNGNDFSSSVTFTNGAVEIAAVPVPAAFLLMGSALGGLLATRRRSAA
jgi:hypothetical protein